MSDGTGRGSRTAATPTSTIPSGPSAIGWRRRRFTRTILVMRAMEATVLCLCATALTVLGLACQRPPRSRTPPADAGTVVTVYVPPRAIDQLMGRLTRVAASHQWALSVRTDSAAVREADLVVADSAGALVGRLRPGSPAAAQARQLAEAVLR